MNHIILLHDFNPLNAYGFNSLIFSRSYTAYMQESQVDSVLIFGFCQFNFHQLSLQLPLQPNNPYIKQLLYEVEHDIMNYQCHGLSYQLNPKAKADNTDTRFDNLWHCVKTKFYHCLILHFLNNLQKKTLWEPNMDKGPGN